MNPREQMIAMMFPPPVADMLLNAYAAAVGLPALVTSTVLEVLVRRRVRSTTGPWTTPAISRHACNP